MAISSSSSISPSGADAVHTLIAPLFEQGLLFHGQGELAKAMYLFEQVLKLAPRHFDALHLVGIVAFQTGDFEMAAGFFRSALLVQPDHATAHSNLGNALKEMQHLEDALLSYERALELSGGDADTYYNRGVALQALQRHADALSSYDQALAIHAGDDQAWNNRAAALQHSGQVEAALHSVRQALALNPHNVEAHNQCGTILQELGRPEEAEASYRRALELVPDYADAHHKLGGVLLSRGRFRDALRCWDRAISLNPRLLEAYQQRAIVLRKLNRLKEARRDLDTVLVLQRELVAAYRQLGTQLQELGRPESAARVFGALLALDDSDADIWQLHARMLHATGRRELALLSIARALALQPERGSYHLTHGAILSASQRYAAAQLAYERAVQLEPRHPGSYTNLGSLLDLIGQPDAALDNYAQALALDPDYAQAHWNRSLVYLRRGDYERGWREYEWRWKTTTAGVLKGGRGFSQPAWTGREALAGKTVLLHAEQGLGDMLQFCRYAPLVAQRGASVVLEVPAPLAGLLATLAGVARIVVKGEALPPFDYHIPMMSLPLAFDTRLDTVPGAAPYLASEPARVAQWRALLGAQTRPRVGLVWNGNPSHKNDVHRSVPLAQFARLLSERCEFIRLQKELRPADQPLLDALPVRQVGELLRDFSDTAALCELMDVVITVDTSVAIWPARWASRCGCCCRRRSSGAGWSRARTVRGIRARPCTASRNAATGRRSSMRWRRIWTSWPRASRAPSTRSWLRPKRCARRRQPRGQACRLTEPQVFARKKIPGIVPGFFIAQPVCRPRLCVLTQFGGALFGGGAFRIVQHRAFARIAEVDGQADHQPDAEGDPGGFAQVGHQHHAEDHGQCRHHRHARAAEGAFQVGTLLAQDDHGHRHQAERGQRADVDQLGQHVERHHGGDQAEDDADQPGGEERRLEARVHRRQAFRQQAIARHGVDDAGLAEGHHQDHGGHAEDGAEVDEAGEPVLTGVFERQRDRVVDAEELLVGHDAGHDGRHDHIQHGAGGQRADDADRQVALGALDFLGGRGDGVEADEGEEHQRRRAQHAVDAEGHEGVPVGRLHVARADEDEQHHDAELDRHHDVVQARRFTHAPAQHGRQQQHDAQRRQVDQGGHAGQRAGRGRQRHGQVYPEAGDQRLEVAGPADRHGRRGQAVFEQQVPAYHPCGQLADGGVGVGVDRAGHRHGRGEFGVAQRGEAAGDGGDDEGQGQRRAGRDGAGAGQHEDTGADDGAYAHQDQVEGAEDFGQAARLAARGNHIVEVFGAKNTQNASPVFMVIPASQCAARGNRPALAVHRIIVCCGDAGNSYLLRRGRVCLAGYVSGYYLYASARLPAMRSSRRCRPIFP